MKEDKRERRRNFKINPWPLAATFSTFRVGHCLPPSLLPEAPWRSVPSPRPAGRPGFGIPPSCLLGSSALSNKRTLSLRASWNLVNLLASLLLKKKIKSFSASSSLPAADLSLLSPARPHCQRAGCFLPPTNSPAPSNPASPRPHHSTRRAFVKVSNDPHVIESDGPL